MVATFCVGLRNDSRVYKSLTDNNILTNDTLLALLIDDVRNLTCALAGVENKNVSIYHLLTGNTIKENKFGFATVEDFEKARKSIIERS